MVLIQVLPAVERKGCALILCIVQLKLALDILVIVKLWNVVKIHSVVSGVLCFLVHKTGVSLFECSDCGLQLQSVVCARHPVAHFTSRRG